MKNFKLLVAAFLPLGFLVLSSCNDCFPGIRGDGEVEEEYRSVSDFDALAIAIPGTVYLTQGPNEEVVIEAQPNILENIETNIRKGKLTIKFTRNVGNHKGVKIYLSSPVLSEISVSGSGKVEGQNLIKSDRLIVSVSGSGEAELDIETEELQSAVSGSGRIYLTGYTTDQEVRISGSGDMKAFELESERAVAQISGSGKAELFVSEKLEARVSGSGDVFYKGSPEVSANVSGSGKVKRAD